jgi:hypothetical protein
MPGAHPRFTRKQLAELTIRAISAIAALLDAISRL